MLEEGVGCVNHLLLTRRVAAPGVVAVSQIRSSERKTNYFGPRLPAYAVYNVISHRFYQAQSKISFSIKIKPSLGRRSA